MPAAPPTEARSTAKGRAPRPVPVLSLLLLAALLLCACRSVAEVVVPGGVERANPNGVGVASGLGDEHLNRQWITKLDYSGPEGDYVMSLIVRLRSADRFSIQAKDRLGRTWWDLAVDGGDALSLQRRDRTFCRYTGAVEVSAVPLGPMEFSVLPALLLNRLPFDPVESSVEDDGEWSFVDGGGRRWTAHGEAGDWTSWTLYEAGEPSIWWSRIGDMSVLSAREDGIQLRWRNGGLRALGSEPLAVAVPDGYRRACEGVAPPEG